MSEREQSGRYCNCVALRAEVERLNDDLHQEIERVEELERHRETLRDQATQLREGLDRAVTENNTLKRQLCNHLLDLHNGSSRPCPTCRVTAELLEIELGGRGRCCISSNRQIVKDRLATLEPGTGEPKVIDLMKALAQSLKEREEK